MNATEWIESPGCPFKNRDTLASHLGISRQQLYNIEKGKSKKIDVGILKKFYAMSNGLVTIFSFTSGEEDGKS